MAADWSTLPHGLLGDIALKLETIENFIYFSAVCLVWNAASTKIKHKWKGVPWLLLAENKTGNPNCLRKIFNPGNNKCYHLKLPETFGRKCWGTPYGWVVMLGRDFSAQLFNPITKAQIPFPSSEAILDFDKQDENRLTLFLCAYFLKVIVLKGDHDEFVIVLFTPRGLLFARHEDQYWTVLLSVRNDVFEVRPLADVVGIDDKLFGLFYDGSIVYWNVNDFQAGVVVNPMDLAPSSFSARDSIVKLKKGPSTMYLVPLDGDFIMILRAKEQVMNADGTGLDFDVGYETLGFEVLRLDLKKNSWKQVEDLGGMALFVGGNSPMSISGKLPKNLQRDCIYFTDDEYEFLTIPTEFGGHDMGVYDMKCKGIRRFYQGSDMRSSFCPPVWFLPQP